MSLRPNGVSENATQRTLEHVLAIGSLFGRPTKTGAGMEKDTGMWEQWSQQLVTDPDSISKILKKVKSEDKIDFFRLLVRKQHDAKTVFAAWKVMPNESKNNKTLAFELLNSAGRTNTDKDMVHKIVQSFSDQLKKDIDVMAHAIGYNMEVIKLVPNDLKRKVVFAIKLVPYYYDTDLTEMPWKWFDEDVFAYDSFKKEREDITFRRGVLSSYQGA